MAFRSTIQTDRLDFDVTQLGSSRNIRTRVGQDSAGNIQYFLMLTLDRLPGGDLEFTFALVQSFADGQPDTVIHQSAHVAQLVPQSDRRQIRQLLLRLTPELLPHAGDSRIYMNTYDAHLPDQALEKYIQLCDIFMLCGYKVTHADPYHGRHQWVMDRVEAADVE